MAKVTYMGSTYECVTAIRGIDYIHLLNGEGIMVAAFDGITDFTYFSISDGEWQEPKPAGDCSIAIFAEDGTVKPGPHKCKDLSGWQAVELVPLMLSDEPVDIEAGSDITVELPKAIEITDKSIYEICVDVYGLFSLDVSRPAGVVATVSSLKSVTSESGSTIKSIDMHLVPTTLASDGSDGSDPVLSLTFPRICHITGIYKAGSSSIITVSGYRYGEKEIGSSLVYEAPNAYESVDKIKLQFSKDAQTYGIIFKYREISI